MARGAARAPRHADGHAELQGHPRAGEEGEAGGTGAVLGRRQLPCDGPSAAAPLSPDPAAFPALPAARGAAPLTPPHPPAPLQTVAVSLAAKHGRLGDALAVYRLMLQDGVQPKSPTFNAREFSLPTDQAAGRLSSKPMERPATAVWFHCCLAVPPGCTDAKDAGQPCHSGPLLRHPRHHCAPLPPAPPRPAPCPPQSSRRACARDPPTRALDSSRSCRPWASRRAGWPCFLLSTAAAPLNECMLAAWPALEQDCGRGAHGCASQAPVCMYTHHTSAPPPPPPPTPHTHHPHFTYPTPPTFTPTLTPTLTPTRTHNLIFRRRLTWSRSAPSSPAASAWATGSGRRRCGRGWRRR